MTAWNPSGSRRSVGGLVIEVTSYQNFDYSWNIFCRLGGFDLLATGRGFPTLKDAQRSADYACKKLLEVGAEGRVNGTS